MIQDPIFDPWSSRERVSPAGEPNAGPEVGEPDPSREDTIGFLRSTAVGMLETVGARLRLARHETSLQDLLDEPPNLLRFELAPWPGPFPELGAERVATLEIGVGDAPGEPITAWYWLRRSGEAPDRVASIPRAKLTASWLERVILSFVGSVLDRS